MRTKTLGRTAMNILYYYHKWYYFRFEIAAYFLFFLYKYLYDFSSRSKLNYKDNYTSYLSKLQFYDNNFIQDPRTLFFTLPQAPPLPLLRQP